MHDHKPICRVERWRGYVTSTFVLRTPDGGVFESRPYRWRKAADPPDEGDARRAYDELTAELTAAGWSVVGHGDAWYAAEWTHPSLTVAPSKPKPPARAQPVPQPVPQPAESPPAESPPAESPPPAPVVVLAEAAPQAPQPPAARRRRRGPLVVAGAVAVTAAAGVAAGTLLGPGRPAAAPSPHVQRHTHHRPKQTATTAPAPTPAPPAKRPSRVVHVAIAATGAGSWVEVRRRSSTGPVLFAGVLAGGRTLRFAGPRLWARFGAAGNLRITQDGRPVALQGTYDKVFRQSRR